MPVIPQEAYMLITNEERRASIREECARRGVKVVPYGKALWLEGNGVSLLCADLAYVSLKELRPTVPVFER